MSETTRGLTLDSGTEPPVIVSSGAISGGPGVAFTTREGGISRTPYASLNLSLAVGDEEDSVLENRRRAAAAAGFPIDGLALLKQVHGCAVISAPAGACGVLGEADGLVSTEADVVLGVLSADCVPVLLAGSGVIGAAHAGWRGLVAGVIEATIDRMRNVERAWVGPAIRACCYEVGAEVIQVFRDRSLPVADERHVDPPAVVVEVLRRSGVREIEMVEACTCCDDSFFSHRRDGVTGRQGAFIWAT